MVPLVSRSQVYLHQEQKNACFDPKPTILVRNLMRVFFKDEVIKKSNYEGGGTKGYQQLNPSVIGETTLCGVGCHETQGSTSLSNSPYPVLPVVF